MCRRKAQQTIALIFHYTFLIVSMLTLATTANATDTDVALDSTQAAALSKVVVSSTKQETLIDSTDRSINSQNIIGKEGIEKLGGPGQTNTWNTLRLTPSVNLQNADPYGLSRPSSMRLRGKMRGSEINNRTDAR